MLKENPAIRRFVYEHAQWLCEVLHRAGLLGISFGLKKLQLFKARVTVLGQDVFYEGRTPDLQKIDRIKTWPVPTTLTTLRGFLGFAG
ncbi:hypothetical protein BOTBODRAFT_105918, partial [Botryobasidium botryosum FD-172 SS1]